MPPEDCLRSVRRTPVRPSTHAPHATPRCMAGATSGSKMTPLFGGPTGTCQRKQLIIDLMATGFPTSMVVRYNVSEYLALAEHGQDVAMEFLSTGRASKQSITLCPVGARISDDICE